MKSFYLLFMLFSNHLSISILNLTKSNFSNKKIFLKELKGKNC